jgi:Fe-S-cluster-containing hydrogenase component 2
LSFFCHHNRENINARPQIDFNLCTGCGICASICPGLAISIRKLTGNQGELTLPFEFLPRPEEGSFVHVVDREGKRLAKAEVLRVRDRPSQNKTALITLKIDRQYLYDAAAIEVTP